jgi:hypothetical protein
MRRVLLLLAAYHAPFAGGKRAVAQLAFFRTRASAHSLTKSTKTSPTCCEHNDSNHVAETIPGQKFPCGAERHCLAHSIVTSSAPAGAALAVGGGGGGREACGAAAGTWLPAARPSARGRKARAARGAAGGGGAAGAAAAAAPRPRGILRRHLNDESDAPSSPHSRAVTTHIEAELRRPRGHRGPPANWIARRALKSGEEKRRTAHARRLRKSHRRRVQSSNHGDT